VKPWLLARRIVQVAALCLFAAPLLVSGWSLLGLTPPAEDAVPYPAELPFFGSLSSSGVAGVTLLDPFAALEVIVATHSVDPAWLLAAALVLIPYALIGARAFCGWVCPVNLLLELVDRLRIGLKLPVVERAIPRHSKLWIALGFLAVAAVTGKPLFENLSPIAAVGKGILFGSLAGIVVLVAILLAELFWAHRVWCRSLCPVGALYQIVGRIGIFKVHIDRAACTGCQRCKQVCLASPEILDPAITGVQDRVKAGDCMRCGACVDECPERALKLGVSGGRR
jgi:ferredoxin-type protein NapH